MSISLSKILIAAQLFKSLLFFFMEVMKLHEATVRLACPRRTGGERVQSSRYWSYSG
jgi:hypothetical protein